MPSPRTTITELSTALGMLGAPTITEALHEKPPELAGVDEPTWDLLRALERDAAYARDFYAGFVNGRAFLASPEALAGRRPRLVEWTGGRRPPGDEVVPSDLRIDHVYLVSCKYLSHILHNPSPARLVEGLLTRVAVDDRSDWYQRVAPDQHRALYEAAVRGSGTVGLPAAPDDLGKDERRRLAAALRGGWPAEANAPYEELCAAVSQETARRWRERVASAGAEEMLWRLLRIGSAPYFILGADERGFVRLRIATPWDWRQEFRFRALAIEPQPGGQPRVGWTATYEARSSGVPAEVRGHVEVRWSHGRFGQRPEAKVYLDTRPQEVPGYHPL